MGHFHGCFPVCIVLHWHPNIWLKVTTCHNFASFDKPSAGIEGWVGLGSEWAAGSDVEVVFSNACVDDDTVLLRLQLLHLPASPTVVTLLESYVKNYAVNTATSSCIDRPTRLTRSVDDDKQMALLDNKYVLSCLSIITVIILSLIHIWRCRRRG